jgi:hypothetical protein
MRTLTIILLLCASVALADDPASRAKAAWAWSTAKVEPAKTVWAVDSKAIRYAQQAAKPADVAGHVWVVEEFDEPQPSGVPLSSYRWALYVTGSPAHKAWEIRDAKARARDFTKLDAGNRDPSIQRCPWCSGKGVKTMRNGEEYVCPACKGDGYTTKEVKTASSCNCSSLCGCGCQQGKECSCNTARECRLEVTLPANAILYIDGTAAQNQSGTFRTFVSPPIKGECAYQLSISLPGEYGQSETVKVWPGQTSRITFQSVSQDRLPPMQFQNFYPGPAYPRMMPRMGAASGGGC